MLPTCITNAFEVAVEKTAVPRVKLAAGETSSLPRTAAVSPVRRSRAAPARSWTLPAPVVNSLSPPKTVVPADKLPVPIDGKRKNRGLHRVGAALRMHTRCQHIIYSRSVALQSISTKSGNVVIDWKGAPIWGSWGSFQPGAGRTYCAEGRLRLYARNPGAT